jgi:uncharacterized protein (TIRG00374 family)
MRKVFFTIILALAGYYIYTHRVELRLIVDVLGQGDWRWMLAAIGAQLVWLVIIAAVLQATYRLVGLKEGLGRLIPLTTAASFVNVVAPSYGLGALAVLIADGRQRGKATAKVSTAAILYLVYDYFGFMIVLSIGLIVLNWKGVLNTVLIAASLFTITIGFTLIFLALLGIQSTDKLGKAIMWLVNMANRILQRFIHRDAIGHAQAHAFIQDISDGMQHIRRSPGSLLLPGILSLCRKAAMMGILFLVSVAFKHPFNLSTLIAGFTTSYLFTIASITPSGVGFVEGAMTVYLTEMQVPLATSAVISLAYRGITFWLPLAYGVIALRLVGYSPRDLTQARAVPASANPGGQHNNPHQASMDMDANPELTAHRSHSLEPNESDSRTST